MGLHEYHQRLLGATSIFRNVLATLLEHLCHEHVCRHHMVRQVNQSCLSIVLTNDPNILKKAKIKTSLQQIVNTPDSSKFDVTLIVALLRNIPGYQCIRVSASRSHQICQFCDVNEHIDIVRKLRNTAAHNNFADFEDLEKNGQVLNDFPSCHTWNDLSRTIKDCFEEISNFLLCNANFPHTGGCIDVKKKEEWEAEMKIACEQSEVIVARYFNEAIYEMLRDIKKSHDIGEQIKELDDYFRNHINTKLQQIEDLLHWTDEQSSFIQNALRKVLKEIEEQKKEEERRKAPVERREDFHLFKVSSNNCKYKVKLDESIEELVEELTDVYGKDLLSLDEIEIKHTRVSPEYLVSTLSGLKIGETYTLAVTVMNKDENVNRKMQMTFSVVDDSKERHDVTLGRTTFWCHDSKKHIKNYTDISPTFPLCIKDQQKVFLSSEQWNEECVDNFNMNYKRRVNTMDYITNDSQCTKNIHEWFQSIVICQQPSSVALVTNYDVMKQVEVLGQEKEIEDICFENIFDQNKNRECVLIYDIRRSLLLYIRPTVAEKFEIIQEERELLFRDVQIFYNLHKEIIDSSNVKLDIVSLLALTDVDRDDLNTMYTKEVVCCDFCDENLILTKNDISSKDEVSRCFFNLLRRFPIRNQIRDNEILYKKLLSRLLSCMAFVYPALPSILDDCFTHISKVPLTNDQKSVINSSEPKHVVLTGAYGTGKTIVGQRKILEICKLVEEPFLIYYLTGDSNTLLLYRMMELIENYRCELKKMGKVTKVVKFDDVLRSQGDECKSDITFYVMSLCEFASFKGLSVPVNLADVITVLHAEETLSHLVLDEFNGEHLLEDDAHKINKILSSEKMKQSYIFIIEQPLHILRSVHESSVGGSRTESHSVIIPPAYMYQETGMTIIQLKMSVRNPLNIILILQASIKIIKNYLTSFTFASNVTQSTSYGQPVLSSSDRSSKHKPENRSDENNAMTLETKTSPIQDEISLEYIFKNTSPADDHDDVITVLNEFELVDEFNCGHGISGCQAKLIRPFPNGIDTTFKHADILHLHYAFNSFINLQKKGTGTTIICTDKLEQNLCQEALKLQNINAPVYMPSIYQYDEGSKLKARELLSNEVIITDHCGIRGLEMHSVVVILSTNESFAAPYFLESLSRSINDLSFILVNWNTSDLTEDNITMQLIREWEAKNLVLPKAVMCNTSSYIKDGIESIMDDFIICSGDHTFGDSQLSTSTWSNDEHTPRSADSASFVFNQWLDRRGKREIKDETVCSSMTPKEKSGILQEYEKVDRDKRFQYLTRLIANNSLEILDTILESNKDAVQERSCDNNRTLLHDAADFDNVEAIRILIKHNVEVGARTFYSWTALHNAAYKNSANAIRYLSMTFPTLQDVYNIAGERPYDIAAHRQLKEAIQAFKDLVPKCENEEIEENNTNTMEERIIQEYEKVHKDKKFYYLSELIENNKIEDLAAILKSGKNVVRERASDNNRTLLHDAAEYDNVEAITILVGHGANVGETNFYGWTCLHVAAYNDSVNAIRYFCMHYPTLMTAKNKFGDVPYKFAVSQKHEASIQVFEEMERESSSTYIT